MKRINLVSPETRRLGLQSWLKAEFSKSRFSLPVVSVFLLLLILSLWQGTALFRYRFIVASQKEAVKSAKQLLRKNTALFNTMNKERQHFISQTERVKKRLSLLKEAQRRGIEWSAVLANLSGYLPKELWVNNISLDEKVITIAGMSVNNAVVSDFMSRLDGSRYFVNTSFNYTQKKKLEDRSLIDFEVTTHLREDVSR